MISIKESATRLMVRGSRNEISALREHFRYHPNGYFHSDKYAIYEATNGKEGWDGFIYPFQKIGVDTGMILRGRLEELLRFCDKRGFEVDRSKLLPKPLSDLTLQDIPPDIIQGSHELDERQCRSILMWLKHGYGVAHMAVNAGKTATFAGAAAMVKHYYPKSRILYVTVTERLINQARKDFKGFLPSFNISQFGGGKHDKSGEDMVLATISMLSKHYLKLLREKWFQTYMCVMYDEVHHAGSESSERILTTLPAYFRFGASGSRKEDDASRNNAILGHFGPVRNTVKQAELIEEGRSAKPHIYVVDVPEWNNRFNGISYRVDENTPAWALVEGEWRKGTYLGPVIKRDGKGNVVRRIRRMTASDLDLTILNRFVLDVVRVAQSEDLPVDEPELIIEDEAVDVENYIVTLEEDVIESGLHRIQFDGEEEESNVQSKWCLLHRVHDKAVIRFRERNELVVQWANYFSQQGHPTVVVATRTLHIHILHAMIGKAVGAEQVKVLYGADSTGKRNEVFDWFRNSEGGVLITPLIQEGISIAEIRAGIVADFISDWERADQIVGRFIRKKKENNWAELVWFVDRQHPMLRRSCVRMLERLQDVEGYNFYYGVNTPEMLTTENSVDGV